MTTGQRIKAARKNAGMTQTELAQILNIPFQSVSQWERDLRNPKYETLQRIAAALGVSWESLVQEDKLGATIVAYVTEKADLTVKDKNGNVIRQGSGKPWRKMSDAETYRAGFLQFHSEEDRIAFFYSRLNMDGKLAAGGHFFRHLDKDTLSEVADYVMSLSENPLYQPTLPPDAASPAPEDTDNTAPDEKPPDGS